MLRLASLVRCPIVVALVLAATSARAEDRPAIATSVKLDAPATCATSEGFWRSTARRTERLRLASAGDAEVVLEVAVRPSDRGASGDVRMSRAGRAFAKREVKGATCDEVTQALSLVVALAFDPAAKTDLDAEAETEPAPREENASSPAPVVTLPPPVAKEAPADPPTKKESAEARWRFGIGAHANVIGAAAPGASAGFGGFVDLERDASGLAPSFRAGVLRSTGASSANGVAAGITWTIARASVCPVRIDLASNVGVRPCLGMDAGSMAASASAVDRPQDRSRPWLAGTAAVRLAWSPVRAAFIEAEGGAAVPFVRDELAVDPSISLYETPAVVPSAQIAAGVRFP